MFRQVATFGSQHGAQAALSLHVHRLNARWHAETWWKTSQEIFFDLWNLTL